jgi:ribonuclease E
MLINAQRPEELRIAIVQDGLLEDYQVDVAEAGVTRGNIYRGVIANIQPSLNAAFIDYGIERHGFLAIQDVVPDAYYHQPKGGTPRIEEVLERGKPIVVQVAKDAIGQKGASLTTSLSLAGRYLVLTPFEDTRGVSRKVEEEDTRKKLKAMAAGLELPKGCGVIVRTNALGQTKTTLQRDLAALLRLWKRVQSAAVDGKGVRLLYTDQDLIFQALRDRLDVSIEELLVDDDEAFQKAEAYMQAFMPRAKTKLVRYTDRLPLFSRFQLEPQIDRIYDRTVPLPSGGSLVIDATEALTAIDINSGRSTRAATQEETALHTNLEAAEEVARQLRLRDIGGLLVVDFIDMRASKYQRRVEKALRDAMKDDKARSTVGRISPNGLLEINRQRIQQALQVRTHRPCPTCNGMGRLASPELVTLNLLRRVEERAASGTLQRVRIGLHPELADAMQNSRRQELAALEEEFDLKIEIIAAPGLHRPDQQIEWFQREKPVTPRRTKPAPPTLRPWDMALPGPGEDTFEEEDEEPTPVAAKPDPRPSRADSRQPRSGRQARPDSRQARPEPHATPPESAPAEADEEDGDGKRSRKRRRGGRKRKKGSGGATVAGAADSGEAAEAQEPGHDSSDSFEMDDDFVDPEEPEERGAEAADGGGNRAASNKRRRRRKRRGGGRSQGEEGHAAPPEPPTPPTIH